MYGKLFFMLIDDRLNVAKVWEDAGQAFDGPECQPLPFRANNQ
jgi:hypothetical protein